MHYKARLPLQYQSVSVDLQAIERNNIKNNNNETFGYAYLANDWISVFGTC